MLDYRLRAYHWWLKMKEPSWAHLHHPKIDFQDIRYFARPRSAPGGEVDPELAKTFERLGIPLHERDRLAGVAVDAVFDSVSVGTTHQAMLAEKGIIFCSISEAIQNHPELVQKYMGTGGAAHRQLLRRPQRGRLQRRLVLLHPQGRALPGGAVHLLPHQRPRHRPVRAHADRGGGRRLRAPTSRAAPPPRATPTSCTRPWSN
jgi:hypothetical protein